MNKKIKVMIAIGGTGGHVFPGCCLADHLDKNIYDIILVLNYNTNPIIKEKGSAIFIHVTRKNYKKTEGCIAVNKIQLLKMPFTIVMGDFQFLVTFSTIKP